MRKIEDIHDITEYLRTTEEDSNNSIDDMQPQEHADVQNNQPSSKMVKVGTREMTQEEYKQYQEIQRLIPEIDWGADAMFTGYETQCASTVPVALRDNTYR